MVVSDAQPDFFSLDGCFSNIVHLQTIVDLTGDSEEDNAHSGDLSRANTTSRATSRLGLSAEDPIDLDPDDTDLFKATTSVNSRTEMANLVSGPTEGNTHGSQTGAAEIHSMNMQDDASSCNSHLPTHTNISTDPIRATPQPTPRESSEKILTLSRKRKRILASSSDNFHSEEVNDEQIFESTITSSIEPQEPLPSQTFRQLRIQNVRREEESEDTSGTGDSIFGSTPILDVSDSDIIGYKYVTDTLKKHIQDLRASHQYFAKVSLSKISLQENPY